MMSTSKKKLRRAGLRLGLVAAASLALCAFAFAGSATAATQHWAGSSQATAKVPYGSSQEFSGEDTSNLEMKWDFGTAYVNIQCGGLSTSGTAENPTSEDAGTIGSASLELSACSMSAKGCAIKNGTIEFEPLKASTSDESGEDLINYSPKHGTTAALVEIVDQRNCNMYSQYYLEGDFSVSANSVVGQPGEYEFLPEDTHLSIAGVTPVTLEGGFALSTPSEEALVLSSEVSPGAPHWYVGAAEWTTFAAGESVAYSNTGSMSFDLDGEVFGASISMSCSSGLEGTLENPSGGGAGTSSPSMSFSDCSLPGHETCAVSSIHANELSGTATEVGAANTPALELTPTEGPVSVEFTVVKKEGAESYCNLTGLYELYGSLIATSEGDGNFTLSGDELTLFGFEPATVSGDFALASEAGESLRLQP